VQPDSLPSAFGPAISQSTRPTQSSITCLQVQGVEYTTARRPAYCSFGCAPDSPESWPWPTLRNSGALRSSPRPERVGLFGGCRAHSHPPDAVRRHHNGASRSGRIQVRISGWPLAMANLRCLEATASRPIQPPEVRALVLERRHNKDGAPASGLSHSAGALLSRQARGGTARFTPNSAMANFF